MASNVFVVDSSFKRTQIKVTPGRYLREVLEEACQSRKLSPEGYILKTQNNKTVDLSQPFRLSGLSGGAKLQLTRASKSPGVVSVALQLPEGEGGGRLSDKFPSNTSLWLVLRKYEDAVAGSPSKKLNLTQRGVTSSGSGGAGRLLYEQPCLHLMGRNLETFADLQKTLAQLGYNGGSILIRLSFRNSGQPLEEAMKEISEYFGSVETSVPASSASKAAEPGVGADADGTTESIPETLGDTAAAPAAGEEEKAEMNEATAMTEEEQTVQPSEQNNTTPSSSEPAPPSSSEAEPLSSNTINGISVYRPPSSSTPAAALEPDDPSVYEPTIDHAKAHQASLQRSGQNIRLPSDRELEEQQTVRREKLATVQNVVVRVRYPDQSQIETTIHASETAADLYAKVMDTLAAAPEPFELRCYTSNNTNTQETLPNSPAKRLVRDFGFRGKVLVTLIWSPEASLRARQGPSLKEEYRKHATDLKVELAGQQARGEEAHRTAMQKQDGQGKSGGQGQNLEAKMKKFLGFGKK